MTQSLAIDVVSDVICPWCFLGKRRLDQALSELRDLEISVNWRPYLLDPSIPKAGMDRTEYLTRKFGADRLATLHEPLQTAGDAEGVPFNFAAITRMPNTLDAHRLIRWSHAHGKQHAMAERLFMDYWHHGKDVSEKRVLIEAAVSQGLDGTIIAQLLDSEADLDPVIAEINQAYEIGVTGVPAFILAGRHAVLGAQSPQVLVDAIRRVAAMNMQRQPAE